MRAGPIHLRPAVLPALLRRHWRRLLPYAVIIGLVLVANAYYLADRGHASPNYAYTGFGTDLRSGSLPGLSTIDPTGGFLVEALGHRAAEDWIHGTVPWWNPYEGLGMPLVGDMQSGGFFLPFVLFYLMPGGFLLMHMVLQILAGIALYLLLRRLKISPVVATGAGVAFALNGTFAWLDTVPLNEIAFLPLAIYGVERAFDSAAQGDRRGWRTLAVAVALSIYAGFPETAFIDGLLVGAWVLVRGLGTSADHVYRYFRKVAMGLATGFLVGAPALVAFIDDLHHAYVGAHNGTFGHVALPVQGSVQLGLPYFLGPIMGFNQADHSPTQLMIRTWGSVGGYVETSIIVLALVGLMGRRLRRVRVLLGVWSLIVAARAYGVGSVMALVRFVPGTSNTAFYRYGTVSLEFSLLVLAGLAVDDLIGLGLRPRVTRLASAAFVTVGFLAIEVAESRSMVKYVFGGSSPIHPWEIYSLAWGLGIVVLICGLTLLPTRFRALALSTVLAVDALAMFVVPEFSALRGGFVDTAPVTYMHQKLGLQRVYAVQGSLQPNYGSFYDVAEIDNNDQPIPGPWASYITRLNPLAAPNIFVGAGNTNPIPELVAHVDLYRAIGVSYIMAPPGWSLPAPFQKVWADGVATVYSLPGAAPYLQVVSGQCSLSKETFDSFRADCRAPSVVVRRELNEPGWSARAGAHHLAVSKSGPLFQSVSLPAGRSTVVFSFRPPHVGWAILGAVFGVILFVAAPWWPARRRPTAKVRADPSPTTTY